MFEKRKEEDLKESVTIARAHIYIERPRVEIKTNFFHSELILKQRERRRETTTRREKNIHDKERSFDDPLLE